ncbi:acyl-CoA thioesterase [Tellurirhabdus bombi]|uniref:acyl-CoA thioesterase n=1 Tax=Tellurirhabdus bombi TaxID=2907205 RepID=UPI001F35BE36|nr:thioesterase family protein [Tellurirhabdus bombi]
MINNIFESKVLWAQIDGNMHLRHSAYADLAAQARVEFLEAAGLSLGVVAGLKIGPILFREELIYLREVRLNEVIKIVTLVTKARPDYSRWSFRHELYRTDSIKAAIINVDGAWLDLQHRKLTGLPEMYLNQVADLPKAEDYQEEPLKE